MALNIESALRLVAKVKGLGDVKKLEKAFGGVESAAKGAAKGFKSVVSSKAFQGMAVAATATATAIALSAKAAIDFEDKMAGVLKVMEDMDTKGVKDLRKEILDLGQELPIAINGIADMYAAAGQSGIARKEMKAFVLDAGRIATAFDISAAEAGTSMAQMRAALNKTQPEVRLLFDAMNHLGNNTAASSAAINEFMKRAGAAGKVAGLAAEQTAALGAAMIGSGTESRVAATALRSLVNALSKGASATDVQVAALRRLGFAQIDAKFAERELTDEVRRQSEERMDIARGETDEVLKQIRRRYDDQLTTIRRDLEDESDAVRDGLRDQADIRIRELTERMAGADNITRKQIEAEIKQIRKKLNTELKMLRRRDEDRMTEINRNLADQEAIELKAQEDKFTKIEELEKASLEKRFAEIKTQTEQAAFEAGQAISENLQTDALGTIEDIFTRIADLPKAEVVSTISDLMGAEAARGMTQLIGNMEKFRETMQLINQDTNFAGSTLKEFNKQNETTAAQLQRTKNAADALAITFGEPFSKSLKELAKGLTPIIQFAADLLNKFPGLTAAVAAFSATFVGLTAGIPIFAALKGGVAVLGIALAPLLLKFGLVSAAIAGLVLVGKSLMDNWEKIGDGWNFVVKGIETVKLIAKTFDNLTFGLIRKIKDFVDWGLRQIERINNFLFKSRKAQASSSNKTTATVPAYGDGGYVTSPRMALIGEGGNSEYVLPSNKISKFISNYQSGLRGQAAIPSTGGGGYSSANVNISTGPVMEMGGNQYVTVDDLENALQTFSSSIFANSRSYGGRRFQGLS
jgi:hypothetical protein